MPHHFTLHMIVKDEAPVIERCLASVKPFIDTWTIVDTGSTDGTQEIIKRVMGDLPGALYDRPWVDFGHNRTEAMELAREFPPEWLITLDADEELIVPDGWTWPDEMTADSYEITIVPDGAGMTFTRSLVTKAATPWKYAGVLHEDIVCDQPVVRAGPIPGIHVLTRRDGHREQAPDKYLRDAQVLREAMSRQQYYLAQSLWDHYVRTGDRDTLEQADREFERRATWQAGWDQETWYAAFAHARCLELLGRPAKDVVEAYLVAYSMRPSRAETLTNLARYCRAIGQPNLAELYAQQARTIPPTTDGMYVDHSAYSQPDVRIGVITAPRKKGTVNALSFTLTSVLTSDVVHPWALRVFSDSVKHAPCSIPVECETHQELARRRKLGGIYGTLNLARSLDWASNAKDIAVTLEDDVMCSRGWLRRGIALLDAAEAKLGCAVVISLHDMHGRGALGDEVLHVGADSLVAPCERTFPNGSQGYLMRPRIAKDLARELRWRMDLPEPDQRKAWAMDVGMARLTNEVGIARMLHTEPCLLLHIDGAVSTWATGPGGHWRTDDEHRKLRKTLRFRPF